MLPPSAALRGFRQTAPAAGRGIVRRLSAQVQEGAQARASNTPPLSKPPAGGGTPNPPPGGVPKGSGSGGKGGGGMGLTAAAAVAVPVAGLYWMSQNDPEGFRRTVPGPVADLFESPPSSSSSPPPAKKPPPGARLAVPVPDVDKERNSDAAKKAAMQQELMLDAAAKAYVAQAEAKAAEAVQRRKEVEAMLKMELGQLEAINAKLHAENEEMRKAKEAGKDAAVMPPQVVFQESRLSSEVRDKIEDMVANKTAERIAQLLASPAAGDDATHSKTASIGERGLDRSKEAVLGAGATVDAAQKRIMELLVELEGRTRLEGIRLREAIIQTEEAARIDNLQLLGKQLAAQERELQRIMAVQVQQIKERTEAEVTRRDAAWESQIREEWDAVNKRAEEFASIMCRIADAKAAAEREGLLEADKKDLAAKLQSRANERLRDAAMLGLDAQAAEAVLEDVAAEKMRSASVRGVWVATVAALNALDSKKGLKGEIEALKDASEGDALLQAAVNSIPASVADKGVASQKDLADNFETVCTEARKLLLSPSGSGWLQTSVTTMVQAPFLRPYSDDSLPSGTTSDMPLRRAHYFVRKGMVSEAVKELEALEPRAKSVVSSWVMDATRRLCTEQALRVARSHAAVELASYC